MIRFRNPGSSIETQIAIFRALYEKLKDSGPFSYPDMERVIGQTTLMSSNGFSGERALEKTRGKPDSLNATKMNMKMYAEVFRLLGWISPSTTNKSYPVEFTLIGKYAASDDSIAKKLFEEGLIGYVTPPTETTSRVTYTEHSRFFVTALKTIAAMGGRIYKYELCLGPMSFDDSSAKTFGEMIDDLKSYRSGGDYEAFIAHFLHLADSLGMAKVSVDNTTRFPIAAMRDVGWIKSVRDNEIFKRNSIKAIEITDKGRSVLDSIQNAKDIRLEDFTAMDSVLQDSLIRLTIARMLERSGFRATDSYKSTLQSDESIVDRALAERILFSPYQTLKLNRVNGALGIEKDVAGRPDEDMRSITQSDASANPKEEYQEDLFISIVPSLKSNANNTLKLRPSAYQLQLEIQKLSEEKKLLDEMANILFTRHRGDREPQFYPFVADLFTLIGFPCRESRAGDNGSRFDAIIMDPPYSIPVEIKSPTEELQLSLKAIRQALENKVVMLSRMSEATMRDVTSLAVGYEEPSERAEVSQLISDIHSAYDVKVGVITLMPLLQLAISAIVKGDYPDKEIIRNLKGFLNVTTIV